MKYWLMKSEPSVFGIDDLAAAPKRTSCWDGVRNYQVRNMLRDEFAVGDLAFFYHSSCEVPGIAGIVEVTKQGYPDHTAFDRKHPHHDPESTPDNPRWYMVDVRAVRAFPRLVTLGELKGVKGLETMALLQKGSRLSVQPVTPKEWETICALAGVAG